MPGDRRGRVSGISTIRGIAPGVRSGWGSAAATVLASRDRREGTLGPESTKSVRHLLRRSDAGFADRDPSRLFDAVAKRAIP